MTQHLSRRTFLQMTGIIAVSTTLLPSFTRGYALASPRQEYARILHPCISPDGRTRLLPNTIVTLPDTGGWLKLADIQTMPDFQIGSSAAAHFEVGQLVQVSMPRAVLYQRCSVRSPIMTTMGYGTGAWVADMLPAAHRGDGHWLRLAGDDGQIMGWSSANLWQAATISAPSERFGRVRIDRRMQTMTVSDGPNEVATWAISTNRYGSTGRTTVVSRHVRSDNHDRVLAWSISLSNGLSIGGADWHNHFGTPYDTAQIELHPYLAQWLYVHLAERATIDIV